MKYTKLFKMMAASLLAVPCYGLAEGGERPPEANRNLGAAECERLEREKEENRRRASQLRSNRFLSIKAPLSRANPERYEKEAARLSSAIKRLCPKKGPRGVTKDAENRK